MSIVTFKLQLRLFPLSLQLLPVIVEPPETHHSALKAVPIADKIVYRQSVLSYLAVLGHEN